MFLVVIINFNYMQCSRFLRQRQRQRRADGAASVPAAADARQLVVVGRGERGPGPAAALRGVGAGAEPAPPGEQRTGAHADALAEPRVRGYYTNYNTLNPFAYSS